VTGAAVAELAGQVGTARACALLGRSRATHYRQAQAAVTGPVHGPARPRASPANALTPAERDRVLQLLTSEQYRDKSVAQTWVTLLDDGTYLASMSTMRRVLRAAGLAGERRAEATHPARGPPGAARDRARAGLVLGHRAPRGVPEPSGDGRAPPPVCRSRPVVAEGSSISGMRGRAEAALTTTGRASTARWPGSG